MNRQGPLAPVVKGVAAGIGLLSEYRHHRKDQETMKGAETTAHVPETDTRNESAKLRDVTSISGMKDPKVTDYEVSELSENDEQQWKLDEAQDEVCGTQEEQKSKSEHDPAKMVKQFTDAHPPSTTESPQMLALPVVLPQRRPKDRVRGFVRAYAPELQNCDIDQETFLKFIETFNAATLASPWLDAINLASLALVTLPTGISQAVSIAIAVAVDITKNMQSRYRHSYVLEQLNNDFFRPRGLYALVLTWKPDSDSWKTGVNVNAAIADNMAPRQGVFDKAKHSFRPSTGNTVGVAFAQTAPLVFPILDSLVNSETPESKDFKQKLKHGKGLVSEYFDRRAQAEHAGMHPDSQLAVTKPTFTSRYSDPNNPTNSGDLLSLFSGGKLSRPQRRGLLSRGMDMAYADGYSGRGRLGFQQYLAPSTGKEEAVRSSPQLSPARPGLSPRGSSTLLGGGLKRVFQHHVLYLAIINMPSDAELAEAKEYLSHAESRD